MVEKVAMSQASLSIPRKSLLSVISPKIRSLISLSTRNDIYIYLKSHCIFDRLTPNDPCRCRIAPLTSKHCILYIYSTNIGTEYSKHGIDSTFFSLQNAVCFIILTYLVPVLFTFYTQVVLKFKK